MHVRGLEELAGYVTVVVETPEAIASGVFVFARLGFSIGRIRYQRGLCPCGGGDLCRPGDPRKIVLTSELARCSRGADSGSLQGTLGRVGKLLIGNRL